MQVLSKWKVKEVAHFKTSRNVKQPDGTYKWAECDAERVELYVVTGGSPENDEFAMHSPSGTMQVVITNPVALGKYKPGEEYFFQSSPASERGE